MQADQELVWDNYEKEKKKAAVFLMWDACGGSFVLGYPMLSHFLITELTNSII